MMPQQSNGGVIYFSLHSEICVSFSKVRVLHSLDAAVAQVAFALGSQLPRARPATDSEQPNLRPFYYHPRSSAPTRAAPRPNKKSTLGCGGAIYSCQDATLRPPPYLQPNFCCGRMTQKKSNAKS